MGDKLKLCPFCEGKATRSAKNMHGLYQVFCLNEECHASTGWSRDADARWNRRAEPDIGITITENVPLTLDELRGMDGEPVWIESGAFWALVHTYGTPDVVLIENSGEVVKSEGWMKRMGNIYRRKPEGEGDG